MQTAQSNTPDPTNDISAQYDEFRTLLTDFLYGNDGYFGIETILKDVLFVLNNTSKGKKK